MMKGTRCRDLGLSELRASRLVAGARALGCRTFGRIYMASLFDAPNIIGAERDSDRPLDLRRVFRARPQARI